MTPEHSKQTKEIIPIRPHHVKMPQFRNSLMGLLTPEAIAHNDESVWNRNRQIADEDYYEDTMGVDLKQIKATTKRRRRAFRKYGSLSDSDRFRIGMPKDSICTSCAIGKHCDATNYSKEDNRVVSRVESEQVLIGEFIKVLLDSGFVFGKDFQLGEDIYDAFDYENKPLTHDNPTPIAFYATDIVLEVGVLRNLISEKKI